MWQCADMEALSDLDQGRPGTRKCGAIRTSDAHLKIALSYRPFISTATRRFLISVLVPLLYSRLNDDRCRLNFIYPSEWAIFSRFHKWGYAQEQIMVGLAEASLFSSWRSDSIQFDTTSTWKTLLS